jgi:hypothetical protein
VKIPIIKTVSSGVITCGPYCVPEFIVDVYIIKTINPGPIYNINSRGLEMVVCLNYLLKYVGISHPGLCKTHIFKI